jgi:hypothetical protein
MKRMTLAQIVAGGIVACILIGTGFYFLSIQPNSQALAIQQKHNADLQGVVAKMPMAEKRVQDAKDEQALVTRGWADYIIRKSPPTSTINLAQNRWKISTQYQTFITKLTLDVTNHIRKTGVTIQKGPGVPPTTDNPNILISDVFHFGKGLSYPCAVYPFKGIEVRGTFDKILKHFESWNKFPNYIALADGLKLSGTSPNLVGTYDLTVLVFPRGDSINGEQVNWLGDSGQDQSGGGFAGGPGGPGGPAATPGGGRMLKGNLRSQGR